MQYCIPDSRSHQGYLRDGTAYLTQDHIRDIFVMEEINIELTSPLLSIGRVGGWVILSPTVSPLWVPAAAVVARWSCPA